MAEGRREGGTSALRTPECLIVCVCPCALGELPLRTLIFFIVQLQSSPLPALLSLALSKSFLPNTINTYFQHNELAFGSPVTHFIDFCVVQFILFGNCLLIFSPKNIPILVIPYNLLV